LFRAEHIIGPARGFSRGPRLIGPLNCPERKIMWAQAGGSDHFPKPFSSLHFWGYYHFFWLLQPTRYFHLHKKMTTYVFNFSVGYCPSQVTLSGSIPSCYPIQPYDKETLAYLDEICTPKTIQSAPIVSRSQLNFQ
jgi:hypothetical protein